MVRETVRCYEDGPMKHYWVRSEQVTYYEDEPVYDSKGRRTGTRRVRKTKTVYHNVPYTNHEYTYKVISNIGETTIADRNLPENPNSDRYNWLVPVPDYPGEVGIPPFWAEARDRIARGDSGPVTMRKEYANYILASHRSILHRFSDSIDKYEQDGLMPQFNHQVHSFYLEDRVYMVGASPAGNWQDAINRFNGALGTELQGDLHLVIVDANRVTDPDNYFLALMAYWLSPSDFGHDALSKNGIVVVLGTKDNQTVSWARAGTGMPEGNEAMAVDVQSQLKGVKLDPQSVLGRPKASSLSGTLDIGYPDPKGALQLVLWGPNKFQRVHMGKPGESGNIGYSYLLREVEPTGMQHFWVLFVTCVFGCVAWGICIYAGVPATRNYRSRH